MSWNYRVMKADIMGEDCYAIHEVYYNADGNPSLCTVEDVGAGNQDSVVQLKQVLLKMLSACDEPTLNFEDMEGSK